MATGHAKDQEDKPFLVSINTANGDDHWIEELPALPVKGGTAIDHTGRIYISLENGELLCYEAN